MKARATTESEVQAQQRAEQQEKANNEARQYLRDTDWYVIREADTGEAVPEVVKQKRAEARSAVRNR